MGFEPTTSSLGSCHPPDVSPNHTKTCAEGGERLGAAHSAPGLQKGASGAGSGPATEPSDLDLADVIRAWPRLPEAVKAGIVAMVKASGKGRT